MMVRKEQHPLVRVQKRAHELRHIGRLGHAGGLPLAALHRHLPQGALGCVGLRVAFQPGQRFAHGLHQAAVHRVVAVHRHDQPALGRQLAEHIALGAPEHEALLAQLFAQQLRLGHDLVAIPVAPFAREALVIAQKMKVQNVDHVPDLRAPVVNGRAAKARHAACRPGQKACGGVFFGAAMAQLLNFVKDHGGDGAFGQRLLPAAQQEVVHQVDIRRGQGVGLEAADHMHRKGASVRAAHEARDLVFPVTKQVRRGHHQRRVRSRLRQHGQRLHRFAKAHLIGQQRPVRAQKKRQPLLLKGRQRAGKDRRAGRHALGHPPRHLAAHHVFPRVRQRPLPAFPVRGAHCQRIAQHQPVEVAHDAPVRRKARLAPAATLRPRKQPLAQLRHPGIAPDHPAVPPPVVGEGAVGAVRAALLRLRAVRVQEVGRNQRNIVVHGSATPHRRFNATPRTGLPRSRPGSGTARSVSTTSAATPSQAA